MQTASQLHSIFYCSNKRSYLKPNGWMKTKSMNFSQLGFSRHCQMYKFTSPVQQTKLFVMPNMDDGHLSVPMSILEEDTNTNHAPSSGGEKFLSKWSPPRYLWRGLSVFVLAGSGNYQEFNGKKSTGEILFSSWRELGRDQWGSVS
ncbi:ABC TRANSPORTER PERMEASE PROTEIN-RELATED [Salix purpurea]|uniref:ABC TRANSPORTER PERMEASE PROTEIN-RELATED n=1 Tax=Salix purpurea TaxID=77065 RepID=A0A9Q0PEW9_SALPP|nr:ABC TRANSPORTER PERMEASE PROTEIN-RELATED [Salix purpurea]